MSDPRKPYVRPMTGWWRKNPFFVRYMARELTALVVAAYAFILLAGMLCLAKGEAAFNAWGAVLRHPVSVALHVAALAAMLYHTWSWFDIMPKTMPPIVMGGKRVGPRIITGAGLAAAALATLVLFFAVWSLAS
ncbi:fumarate reductase subunit C [Noviherbaspirillum denitrificans]|uniref:Fumarate reductase n=1 Tax=Noviherbaspirillum denitrificans TaxID=1968433 RepID=A0A254TK17_9BURK|nr:fumarate reductase subunit C [Noviherbaspirillum denitrificans]OWW20943.1 fumarate reductase [Noviherbaspirillum denitrificans]